MITCPICHKSFTDTQALTWHSMKTTKHENIFTYVRRLEFLLAEAEDNLKFWRETIRKGPYDG